MSILPVQREHELVQALLAEGGQLEDPAGFVKRLNQLMLALNR